MDREAEHFLSLHPDMLIRPADAAQPQRVIIAPGPALLAEEAVRKADDCGTCSVAEEDRCSSVVTIQEGRQLLAADDQSFRYFDISGTFACFRAPAGFSTPAGFLFRFHSQEDPSRRRERQDKSCAARSQIKSRDFLRDAELLLNHCRHGRHNIISAGCGGYDHPDLLRRNTAVPHRPPSGLCRQCETAFSLTAVLPASDPGAGPDPLVAGLHDL